MAHPLLDDYKQYKGIVDDSSQNDRIDAILYAVTYLMKNIFGVAVIEETDLTATMSVVNHQLVFSLLPKITALKINGADWDLGNLYQILNVVQGLNSPLPNGKNNADVTYDIGYADDDIPDDLRIATIMLASRILTNADTTGESMEYLSDPVGARMRMLKTIPPEFYLLIAPYRVRAL